VSKLNQNVDVRKLRTWRAVERSEEERERRMCVIISVLPAHWFRMQLGQSMTDEGGARVEREIKEWRHRKKQRYVVEKRKREEQRGAPLCLAKLSAMLHARVHA